MLDPDEFAYLSAAEIASAMRMKLIVVSGAELGPLHGVPTAIEDLFDFKPGRPDN